MHFVQDCGGGGLFTHVVNLFSSTESLDRPAADLSHRCVRVCLVRARVVSALG